MKVAVEDINNKPVPLRLDLRITPSLPGERGTGGEGAKRKGKGEQRVPAARPKAQEEKKEKKFYSAGPAYGGDSGSSSNDYLL